MNELHIFTGKGGVGKTTLALALYHHLRSKGKRCRYVYLEGHSPGRRWRPVLASMDVQELLISKSVEKYVGMKLGSPVAASWIVKTQIFKAIFNMVPGLTYLIDLGTMMYEMENDPELSIVFDSPSTGHVLAMFESIRNFQTIFESGTLYHDATQIERFYSNPHRVRVNVLTLATEMALHESIELQTALHERGASRVQLVMNNVLSKIHGLPPEREWTDYFRQKVSLEREVLKEAKGHAPYCVPHELGDTPVSLLNGLSSRMEGLC